MVLQRDKPINIWGFGAVSEKVTVNFAGQTKTIVTDTKGNWLIVLAPLKTSATPQKMTISGSNKIELTNILVGEVWLCSGQSNMEYAMRKLAKIPKPKNEKLGFPADEVAKAKNKQIRIFLVNRKALIKPDSVHKSWAIAQDSALRNFSAVGYFFAKELQEKLGIPIGIISSAVPGSAIEPWISNEAFANEPFFKGQKIGNDPSKFYTPMVEPLNKFALRGFLWYQGETNCFLGETISYAYKMKALITSWRKAWNDDKMPFYYVQIAPYNYSKTTGKVIMTSDTEPGFWEAQAQLLRLPNTGTVITTDLNDNQEDLHPTYKWEIGRRLSLWALARTYHQKINFSGPIYKKNRVYENYLILSFEHIGFFVSKERDQFEGFEIANKDGKFIKAKAFQKGNEIIVSSPEIANPKYVRYNWTENPTGNFYSNGLPALPFRTNNPLTNQFKIN
ncbi:sialate O-acetylesterase [Pedobacter polaris]|uniref:Sialate O-acetylesterase n=2 Tax=Pedobacter polaris TaxID=2571273 RepID=A0A4U1CUW3_9SPHI|nr:sialate O-acetylesterase [Pedobacter polaris]